MKNDDTYKILVALSVILLLFFLKTDNISFILINLTLLLTSIFSFKYLKLIINYWNKVTEKIGGVISKIVLTIIFFMFLTPMALIYKLFNKEIYNFFYKNFRTSYFNKIDLSLKRNLNNQW